MDAKTRISLAPRVLRFAFFVVVGRWTSLIRVTHVPWVRLGLPLLFAGLLDRYDGDLQVKPDCLPPVFLVLGILGRRAAPVFTFSYSLPRPAWRYPKIILLMRARARR